MAGTRWPKRSSASRSKTTRRYKELLDDKEIDRNPDRGVPTTGTKQVVVDALAAGKDVYCEKPMSHNPADGLEMVAAYKKTDRIVQIGAQRTSSVLCAKAKELLAKGADRRSEPDRGQLWTKRPERRMGVSAAAGSFAPENLDWDTWLGNGAEEAVRPVYVCALALLEGVWHRRCRGPAGAFDQRHAVLAGHQ